MSQWSDEQHRPCDCSAGDWFNVGVRVPVLNPHQLPVLTMTVPKGRDRALGTEPEVLGLYELDKVLDRKKRPRRSS